MCDRVPKIKSHVKRCCFQIHPTTWAMHIYFYLPCIFILGKRGHIVSQRRINTTIIYNYYMCDCLTKRKSQVKSCRFQIHPTTLVINIFYIRCIFMLVKRGRIVSQRCLDFSAFFARPNVPQLDQSLT